VPSARPQAFDDPEREPAGDTDTAERGGRARRRTIAAFAAAAALALAVPLVASRLVDQPEGEEYVFEIPAGTADRLAAGEDVEVLPADLRLDLRDRLVVVNLDDRAHQIGPFPVAPGERLERRFSDAVSFSGFCSLHADGSIDIEVRPAD
jgi:hypothetical protein